MRFKYCNSELQATVCSEWFETKMTEKHQKAKKPVYTPRQTVRPFKGVCPDTKKAEGQHTLLQSIAP